MNYCPCFIPSPPKGADAFSLVRKVQGRLPVAGEASISLRIGKSLPGNTTPASRTKQKQRAKPVIRQPGQPYTITDERRIARKRQELKREIVKIVADQIYKKMYAGEMATEYDWDAFDEKVVRQAARLAIDLWEERR